MEEPYDERRYMVDLLERILRECPQRRSTSDDERRAQEILEGELGALGLRTDWHRFTFNENLYANLALHFGLSTLGTAVSGVAPSLGLFCHGLAAGSYWADSTRRAYVLRHLLGFKPSQNLLAIRPAKGAIKLRVVLLAHADAALTGLLFHPAVAGRVAKTTSPLLRRSMALATRSTAALAALDGLRMVVGPLALPLRPVEWALTAPSALAFALNLQVVLQDEVVPGASDDLSGVVALPVLARRLADLPDGVEVVYGVTGCEEASLGGADALARNPPPGWDRRDTVVIALDGLCNGQLRFTAVEGEVTPTPTPAWLQAVTTQVAASEGRFSGITGFEVPVGGTDAGAFLAHGWDAVCLTVIDPSLGTARHYHQSTDTVENLDWDEQGIAVDFAEKLVRGVVEARG